MLDYLTWFVKSLDKIWQVLRPSGSCDLHESSRDSQ